MVGEGTVPMTKFSAFCLALVSLSMLAFAQGTSVVVPLKLDQWNGGARVAGTFTVSILGFQGWREPGFRSDSSLEKLVARGTLKADGSATLELPTITPELIAPAQEDAYDFFSSARVSCDSLFTDFGAHVYEARVEFQIQQGATPRRFRLRPLILDADGLNSGTRIKFVYFTRPVRHRGRCLVPVVDAGRNTFVAFDFNINASSGWNLWVDVAFASDAPQSYVYKVKLSALRLREFQQNPQRVWSFTELPER
jgi:hypothetical protein